MKRLLALALAFLLCGGALGSEFKRLSFDELATQSDVVLVARVSLLSQDGVRAEIDPIEVLKGDPKMKRLTVVLRPGKGEADDRCCRKYREYLFFLRKLDNGDYQSTNGRFGFIDVD